MPPLKELALQHFAQSAFQHLLIRAFPSAIEPALELADAHRVLGLGLLDADGQAGQVLLETRSSLLGTARGSFRFLQNGYR